MVRKIVISLLVVSLFCAGGCLDSGPAIKTDSARNHASRSLNTPDGMIDYLQSQRLPALESVELWENEFAAGMKLCTKHYNIYTTLFEPLILSQVPGFIESAYRSYQSQLPSPIETETKLDIYLFSERQQWDDFTRKFAGKYAELYLQIKAGAYYLNGACVVYNIGRERTFSVLGHEGWHQFNSRHFQYRLPSWLDEGIAMLFETSTYEQGLFAFRPDMNMQRLASLKKTLIANRMIPLRQLTALNPGEVLGLNQDEAVAAFYSQAYALVRFLREEDYGKRRNSYHKLLNEGLMGKWPLHPALKEIAANRNIPLTVSWNRAVGAALFEYYIGENLDEIEEEYVKFCKKIVYHIKLIN